MSGISLDRDFNYDAVLSQSGKTEINTDRRAKLKSMGFFERVKHFFQIRKEDRLFFEKIFSIFQQHFHIDNQKLFKKIWDKSLADKKIRLAAEDTLTVDQFKLIDSALKEHLVYSGKGIKNEKNANVTSAQQLVGFLLSERSFPTHALDAETLKAILIKKDDTLLAGFRSELQNALLSCMEEANLPKNAEEEVLFKTYIGNVLSFLPFAYPEEGYEVKIPQKINGSWVLVDYTLDKKMNLTPEWFSSPIPAIGFLPKNNPAAPPLLLCLGTTYPTGDGYVATLLADFTPGMSVGHAPYLLGKKEIESWLSDKTGVHVYGMSLGGATGFQITRHHADKIASAELFNPPGLYAWNWDKEYSGNDHPKINIYTQKNDLISSMGSFPTGENVSLYEVLAGDEGRGENPIYAHARAHTGMDKVTIVKLDPKIENKSITRIALTFLHITLGPIVLFIPILMIHLVIRLIEMLAKLLMLPFTLIAESKGPPSTFTATKA